MLTLPFSRSAALAPVAALASHFEREHRSVLVMSQTAPLVGAVGAGLCALQTPSCQQHAAPLGDDPPRHGCPVCSAPFRCIAPQLPALERSSSSLICRLTGEPMDGDNVPMVLPDGQVYSLRAIEALAAREGGGSFCHPLTRQPVALDQLRKAFFL